MPRLHSGVAIVGSANMDIVFAVDRVPRPGETMLAEQAALYPGGKGLNQAIAAARAGAATTFVGAVGRDDHGAALVRVLDNAGVERDQLRLSDRSTGQAFIIVDSAGENTIVVASGANASVTALTDADAVAISRASVLLMQLELPMGVIVEAARIARASGVVVMVNAAPAAHLADDLLDTLDYLIVNEHEACLIAELDDLGAASGALAARIPRVVVTLGAAGSALFDSGLELARIPARKVDVVDTTGAGDTFCGALAAALADGTDFEAAAVFATAAASLSVQKAGAVPSVPTRAQIEATL